MANSILLLIILTGFFTTLTDAWNLAARLNLLLHPFLGLFFSFYMVWFGRRRIRAAAPTLSTGFWILLPVAMTIVGSVPGIATTTPGRFLLIFWLLAGWLLVGCFRVYLHATDPERVTATINYVGLAVWILALHSGLTGLTLGFEGRISFVFLTHRYVAIAFTAALLIQLTLDWLALRRSAEPLPPRLVGTVVASAAAAAALAGVYVYESSYQSGSLTVHLSTIPVEDRKPHEREMLNQDPTIHPTSISLTRSCLTAGGCHKDLAEGFFESNHNISLQTPHIQKNMDLMASEIGEHNTQTCLGCHAPAAMFEPGLDRHHFVGHDNFSCSFCHVVSDVWLDPEDHFRSSYTVSPPQRHTDLFIGEQGEQELDWLATASIMMNPLGHARAFSPAPVVNDVLCIACHRHQIELDPAAALMQPRCVDCHMQPLSDFGETSGERNHFMPGANQLVPLFANRPRGVQLVNDWIDGRYVISIGGWENRGWDYLGVSEATASDSAGPDFPVTTTAAGAGKLRERLQGPVASFKSKRASVNWSGRPGRSVWLSMILRTETAPVPGTTAELELITSNAGIGHDFPAAPLDLAEVWLDVHVRDATGATIYRSGALDSEGFVPPDAATLGGSVVAVSDGTPIELYRVWHAQKNVVDRVLGEGRHLTDTIRFPVPIDVRGPLTVEAHWNYRKLNRTFLNWAYGPEQQVPILRVGSLSRQVALDGAPLVTPIVPGY